MCFFPAPCQVLPEIFGRLVGPVAFGWYVGQPSPAVLGSPVYISTMGPPGPFQPHWNGPSWTRLPQIRLVGWLVGRRVPAHSEPLPLDCWKLRRTAAENAAAGPTSCPPWRPAALLRTGERPRNPGTEPRRSEGVGPRTSLPGIPGLSHVPRR